MKKILLPVAAAVAFSAEVLRRRNGFRSRDLRLLS